MAQWTQTQFTFPNSIYIFRCNHFLVMDKYTATLKSFIHSNPPSTVQMQANKLPLLSLINTKKGFLFSHLTLWGRPAFCPVCSISKHLTTPWLHSYYLLPDPSLGLERPVQSKAVMTFPLPTSWSLTTVSSIQQAHNQNLNVSWYLTLNDYL